MRVVSLARAAGVWDAFYKISVSEGLRGIQAGYPETTKKQPNERTKQTNKWPPPVSPERGVDINAESIIFA